MWTCRFEAQASPQVLQQAVASGHSLVPNLKGQEDEGQKGHQGRPQPSEQVEDSL